MLQPMHSTTVVSTTALHSCTHTCPLPLHPEQLLFLREILQIQIFLQVFLQVLLQALT
jgi:hypothetical protein